MLKQSNTREVLEEIKITYSRRILDAKGDRLSVSFG